MGMSAASRVISRVTNPRDFATSTMRRILPTSPRYGADWVHLPDGSVTFRERGFVEASSPVALLARHNHEVRRIQLELSGMSVARSLEIGCGFGRLSMTLAAHSREHIAIDINESALAAARQSYPGIQFRQGSTMRLPFPNQHFDLVCTWTVMQHIRPESIGKVAREIRRVLAPGGSLLICEETRDPEGSGGHTWHRSVGDYEILLRPLKLIHHSHISEIDLIPGMVSPGEVFMFQG